MPKILMIGRCPECRRAVTSKFPFQIGTCPHCNPSVQVPLQLAILPAKRHIKRLEEITKLRDTSVKKLVKELLDVWL